jgi:hypothetical protein
MRFRELRFALWVAMIRPFAFVSVALAFPVIAVRRGGHGSEEDRHRNDAEEDAHIRVLQVLTEDGRARVPAPMGCGNRGPAHAHMGRV